MRSQVWESVAPGTLRAQMTEGWWKDGNLTGTGQHLRGGTGTGDPFMGCSAGSGPTGSSVEEVARQMSSLRYVVSSCTVPVHGRSWSGEPWWEIARFVGKGNFVLDPRSEMLQCFLES